MRIWLGRVLGVGRASARRGIGPTPAGLSWEWGFGWLDGGRRAGYNPPRWGHGKEVLVGPGGGLKPYEWLARSNSRATSSNFNEMKPIA